MADFVPSTAGGLSLPTIRGRWPGSPRVLVVEDDRDIADVLRRALGMDGYEVARPATGRRRSTEAAEFTPDAVVLDLGLPKLDGSGGVPPPAQGR